MLIASSGSSQEVVLKFEMFSTTVAFLLINYELPSLPFSYLIFSYFKPCVMAIENQILC